MASQAWQCLSRGCRFQPHGPGRPGRSGYCCDRCQETDGTEHGPGCDGLPVGWANVDHTKLACVTEGCGFRRHSTLRGAFGPYCCGRCKDSWGAHHSDSHCQQLEPVYPEAQPGAEVSLPERPAEVPRQDGGEAKVAARRQAAEWVRTFLQHPLDYEVVFSEGAPVREAPCEAARELARLPKGATVSGFCGQEWLEISSAPSYSWQQPQQQPPVDGSLVGKWAFIGARLRASCMRLEVRRSFGEAIDVAWQGLHITESWRVRYGLKWRAVATEPAADDAAAPSTAAVKAPRHDITTRPQGTISGLTPSQEMQFAVVAQLTLPGGGRPQKISGPWSAAIFCPPLDLALQAAESACLDGAGLVRGGCPASACLAWVAQPRLGREEPEDRCARCGARAEEHQLGKGGMVQLTEEEVATAWPPLENFAVEREAVLVLGWPCDGAPVMASFERGYAVPGYQYGPWVQLARESLPLHAQQHLSEDEGSLWIRRHVDGEADQAPALVVKEKRLQRELEMEEVPAEPEPAVTEPQLPPLLFVCGHSSPPRLAKLLGLHSEISAVSACLTNFVAQVARLIAEEELEFRAFRKEVLKHAAQWAERDDWMTGGGLAAQLEEEASSGHPGLGQEFILQSAHRFLDAVRAGRPPLSALGSLVSTLLAEYLRKDAPGKTLLVSEPQDCAYVLPLLGAACGSAKVLHLLADVRLDVGRSGSAAASGPTERLPARAWAWTEAAEAALAWGLAHPERYLEVRAEDLARRPRGELSRVLTWLGTSAASEADAEVLLQGRQPEDFPRQDGDGTGREPDSPRLLRVCGGRFRAALQHFGYAGDASSSAALASKPEEEEPPLEPCPPSASEEEKAGQSTERALVKKRATAPCVLTDSEALSSSNSPSDSATRRHTASRPTTPSSIRSGMRTPPGITKAASTAFGKDCSDELAMILQRRLERAEPARGPRKPTPND